MGVTRRRLPHIYSPGQTLFVTFHLAGSLPVSRRFPAGAINSGEAFVVMDRLLDASQSGPRWLAEARIAVLVRDSIYHCGVTDYDLHAWVIMPNHVHMLITPRTLPSRFMRRLKGFTARQANAILFRAGKPFWQDETYDHVVRSPREFHLTANYIAENPVKAGLVRAAEEFRWSSVASIRG